MNTIHMPCRPPGYLARQGYVKPLWQVMLRRSDVNPHRTYVPDDEAYNLPALSEKLESDKYSVSTIDHVTVELTRTDELVDFLKGLKGPKFLRIKIFSYLIFRKWQKQLVWFGLLQNLPEGIDAYPWDKLKLTFMSPPGGWEEGDEVEDDDTTSAYRNKHVTDVLLPAFLKEACKQSKGGSRREGKLEPPAVRGDDYFWSGLDRPRKRLAQNEGGRKYDSTYKVKALCWASDKNLLYVGVRGHPAEYDTTPWIMSYDPVGRVWKKVATFTFPKGTGYDFLEPPTQWEILHLEYSGGKIYYVCQTTHQNLKEQQAHFKCYGDFTPGDAHKRLTLNPNNLFTLHNRGVVITSRAISYDNFGVTTGETTYWVYACVGTIGFGTPRTEKKHGVLVITGRMEVNLAPGTAIPKGSRTMYFADGKDRRKELQRGFLVQVYDDDNGRRQSLGIIEEVRYVGGRFIVKVEKEAAHYYPPGTDVYIYNPKLTPFPNVFIAKPQNVKVEFLYGEGFKSPAPATVYVEARREELGRENFVWPCDLGKIDETGDICIDRVGFTSFISFPKIKDTETENNEMKIQARLAAPFQISLEGYEPSFLIADGFRVESGSQTYGKYGPYSQPGKCRLTRYKNGEWLPCRVGSDILETYGDIFLFKDKDSEEIWVAWNAHGVDENTGERYAQCRIAKWLPGRQIFQEQFRDRRGNRWFDAPEYYITSFARYKNDCYGGRRRHDPRWLHTNLHFFWAAPPQGVHKPTKFDGLFVATALLVGDKTDVLEAGDVIALGSGEYPSQPTGRYYYVSEIGTLGRNIEGNSPFLHPKWRGIVGVGEEVEEFKGEATWVSLLSVGKIPRNMTYAQFVTKLITGRCISIKKGYDKRHEIWRL